MESYESVRPHNPRNESIKQSIKSHITKKTASRYLCTSRIERETNGRADFLAIINEHRAMREMVKTAREHEKNQMLNQWVLEEHKAKRKQLVEFLNRLSKAKKTTNVVKSEDNKKVKRLKQQEVNKTKDKEFRMAHMIRREELIGSVIVKKEERYNKKMERLEKLQNDKQAFLERKVKARKENREKKTLRAKVRNILEIAFGMSCKKDILDNTERPTIDELFLESFKEDELKQVVKESNE